MYAGQADPAALSRLRDDLLLERYVSSFPGLELRVLAGEGKRRGLFTTRAFARGSVLLAEAPCLWQEGGPSGPLYCPSHTPDELDGLLYQLAPFYCQQGGGCAPPPALARADLAARVLRENSFGVGAPSPESEAAGGAYGQGSQGRAVYPAVAMANHSCLPSARASQEGAGEADEAVPRRVLEARRDLAAGEEVTISYIPVTWMRAPRRRVLQTSWGFACDCPRCAAPRDDTIARKHSSSAGGGAGAGSQEEEVDDGSLVEALCAPGKPRELVQRLVEHETHALQDVRLFLTLVRLHEAFQPAPALRAEVKALLVAAAAGMPYIALEEILPE